MTLPSRNAHRLIAEANSARGVRRINRGHICETGQIPTGMRLLQDTHSFKVLDKKDAIIEGLDGRETQIMRVMGLFQEGDLHNANGRIYGTSDVLAPAVKQIQEDLDGRAVMGEFDHPSDAKIHLDRVSHLVSKVWMDGRKVYGEAEVLHRMPMGAALRGLFEHKVRVGISSRGVGDMEVAEHNGQEIYRVMPGYAFVTWDAVAEPSVGGAILNIQEGINKRLRPLRKEKSKLSPNAYQNLLVREIDNYFGLGKKKKFF